MGGNLHDRFFPKHQLLAALRSWWEVGHRTLGEAGSPPLMSLGAVGAPRATWSPVVSNVPSLLIGILSFGCSVASCSSSQLLQWGPLSTRAILMLPESCRVAMNEEVWQDPLPGRWKLYGEISQFTSSPSQSACSMDSACGMDTDWAVRI